MDPPPASAMDPPPAAAVGSWSEDEIKSGEEWWAFVQKNQVALMMSGSCGMTYS